MNKKKKKCKLCKGMGIIKTQPIKCKKCFGNINGCSFCKFGYTQLFWKECNTCFETGLEMEFDEYMKLLHR